MGDRDLRSWGCVYKFFFTIKAIRMLSAAFAHHIIFRCGCGVIESNVGVIEAICERGVRQKRCSGF